MSHWVCAPCTTFSTPHLSLWACYKLSEHALTLPYVLYNPPLLIKLFQPMNSLSAIS